MPDIVVRERLLDRLRSRHQVDVIALEAPAGYGRTVLLGQALEEGPRRPGDRDVLFTCGPDADTVDDLVRGIVAACGGAPLDLTEVPATATAGARSVAAALRSTVEGDRRVALVVDEVERSGAAGDALWPALLDRLPRGCHLVLSGRRLPRLGLIRRMASGTGVLLDREDLALDPAELAELVGRAGPGTAADELALIDAELTSWPAVAGLLVQGRPDLVVGYLEETALADADPVAVGVLAAVAEVDGCSTALLPHLLEVVAGAAGGGEAPPAAADLDTVLDELARLPLVRVDDDGCRPHPVWTEATGGRLSDERRRRAVILRARELVRSGACNEAGRLAVRTGNADALTVVVRDALATQPPRASLADLAAWASSDLLPIEAVERDWLAAVVDLQLGQSEATGRARLEKVRLAFETAGDGDGEVGVLLHLGIIARAHNDVAAIVALLQRAEVLAERGNPIAEGLVALGRAITAQMAGDPRGAVRALDRVPPDFMVGEWAAQTLMIRGTNLMLAGRFTDAIAALDAATGVGSAASRAVAHDLLAAARWYSGDGLGAMGDADAAEALAVLANTPRFVQQVRAAKACLLAATGQRQEAEAMVARLGPNLRSGSTEEADALAAMAVILLRADAGDLDGARSSLLEIAVARRAVRSSVWKAALDAALLPASSATTEVGEDADSALSRAVAAGRVAAAHLAGGPPVPVVHRPYLPAAWCTPTQPTVAIALQGACRVARDFQSVAHAAWGRTRVRELCLHLTLVDDRSRSAVAAALWPDRSDTAAGRNLRVTLTHLLDVLDADRTRSAGSSLIVDRDGILTFARMPGLSIDVWEQERLAQAILTTPAYERPALLAHGRRLLTTESGPLLGGSPTGEWAEPHRRRIDALLLSASLHAGTHALAANEHLLAQDLGRWALSVDPWSERAHGLVVEAFLAEGDIDGARRSLLHAVEVLDDLGVAPGNDLVALVHRTGFTRQAARDPGRRPRRATPVAEGRARHRAGRPGVPGHGGSLAG